MCHGATPGASASSCHRVSPTEEPLEAALAVAPLVMGADGMMVPFRPVGGQPTGKTQWREVKVGVLARVRRHCTRTGKVVTRLHHRRVVAVLGDIEALKPRLWLEAVRQGILRAPQVVWLSDGARGLWHLFEEGCSPYATGILDFYHAVQNLWKGAQSRRGAGRPCRGLGIGRVARHRAGYFDHSVCVFGAAPQSHRL